jgi:cell division transport system permease protein
MLVNYEPGLLELITPEVMLCVMGAVFISGILIATLCAYISINKYLKMKAGDLYRL